MLNKCAVKGTRRVKTDQRADFGDAKRGIEQIAASFGNAQGIDKIVKAQAESTAEQVGNIKLVEVELLFQKGKRKILSIVLCAKRNDGTQGFGISHREL